MVSVAFLWYPEYCYPLGTESEKYTNKKRDVVKTPLQYFIKKA